MIRADDDRRLLDPVEAIQYANQLDRPARLMKPTVMIYRADIDGIRALCVLAVIFYHARVPGMSGGFVGVDAFFVISGYLITNWLMSATQGGSTARLRSFYIRRGRRILPALLVVIAASLCAALAILLPADLTRLGRGAALSGLMLGNIDSWLGGDYFDGDARTGALSHLWSIGVEEQFYLLFPWLLLFGIRHKSKRLGALALGLALVSFSFCLLAVWRWPVANYYSLPTRGWQLLVGSALALGITVRFRSRAAAECSAVVALVVLVWSFHAFAGRASYPDAFALAPSLATAMLIASGSTHRTLVSRFLTWRILVFTGLISYSLYLWHMPVLTFFSYYQIESPDVTQTIVLLLAIYVLAMLSWRFVETPIRSRSLFGRDRTFVIVAAATSVCVILAGALLWRSDGIPERFTAETRVQLLQPFGLDRRALPCMTLSIRQVEAGEVCRFGVAEQSAATLLVWGDSHALALFPAYAALADRYRVRLYFAARQTCRPLLDVRASMSNRVRDRDCMRFNLAMLDAVRRLNPNVVVLNAYWNFPDLDLVPIQNPNDKAHSGFETGLHATLSHVEAPDRRVCMVLDPPTLPYPLSYAIPMATRRHMNMSILSVRTADAAAAVSEVEATASRLERAGLVTVANLRRVLCDDHVCSIRSPSGVPLYRDRNHLSIAGAAFVQSALEACFDPSASGVQHPSAR